MSYSPSKSQKAPASFEDASERPIPYSSSREYMEALTTALSSYGVFAAEEVEEIAGGLTLFLEKLFLPE